MYEYSFFKVYKDISVLTDMNEKSTSVRAGHLSTRVRMADPCTLLQ